MRCKLFPEVYLATAYFPPIQYFTKILAAERVCIDIYENYVKQSYRTRCDIYAANGVMQLSIPVEKTKGEKVLIKDVRIDYSRNWQHIHWHSILSAYQSSPFFEYYIDDFRPFFEQKEVFLIDYNNKLLEKLLELTGIKANIGLSNQYSDKLDYPEFDYRQSISPKPRLQIVDKYYKEIEYYQVFGHKNGFAGSLSILDLLCNEGNNSVSVLLNSVNLANYLI